MLKHELLFRGKESVSKIENFSVGIFGIGALGSNLAFNLAKQGFKDICVLDFDRVDENNVGTQIYGYGNVGKLKTAALAGIIYEYSDVEIGVQAKKLDDSNVKKLTKFDLCVDCFDNTAARSLLKEKSQGPVIHAGFNGGYAEIKWNESYMVPSDVGIDICDYPLARNLVTLTTSLLAESIYRFAAAGEKLNFEITFNDLNISSWTC